MTNETTHRPYAVIKLEHDNLCVSYNQFDALLINRVRALMWEMEAHPEHVGDDS